MVPCRFEKAPRGSLMDVLAEDPSEFTWRRRLKYLGHAAAALNHLHTGQDKPITHMSLRSSNLLLFLGDTIKLSEPGFVKFYKQVR